MFDKNLLDEDGDIPLVFRSGLLLSDESDADEDADAQENGVLECPPSVNSRTFNENDILGKLNRDEDGLVKTPEKNRVTGKYKDLKGNKTNSKGYMINLNGDIVNNRDAEIMFEKKMVDYKNEMPSPFKVERFNFNPIKCRGDFDHDRSGRPMILGDAKGVFDDKRGNLVTQKGWRIDNKDNLIDNYGHKKFDAT